jgi:hypothetical protein
LASMSIRRNLRFVEILCEPRCKLVSTGATLDRRRAGCCGTRPVPRPF